MVNARRVTLVSHGPNCLDGLTCAVVAARYFAGRRFEPMFASNREIDEVLRGYDPTHPDDEELWITDISWRDSTTDLHLSQLVERGLRIYWVDHHKTAIDRRAEGKLNVKFTEHVLDASYAASRLLFEYLVKRSTEHGESRPGLLALRNLVLLADDVDRWVLEVPGSRELALAVRAMSQQDAYRSLLAMDSSLTYPPEVRRALERVQDELRKTFAMAEATRHVADVPSRNVSVVAAECDDYAGEIADRWSKAQQRAVFALYDHRSDGISLRRTPDCTVDLSRLAGAFGGGGHPAAAGCQIQTTGADRSCEIARKVVDALVRGADR
jgi:oligoribonuclease NrnB/cAMP/cGMP phosphodiesterase (DHH superfamily)